MRYGSAIVAVGLALLVQSLLVPLFGAGPDASPFMVFFAAVMVAAYLGGLGPGLLATALSAVLAWYFFLFPQYSFQVVALGQGLRLVVFALEGAVISLLVGAMHSARRQSEASANQAGEDRRNLRESEERYRSLVESAEDYAIFMMDADGRIANWNAGAERLFGYREDEVVGEPGSLLFVPEDIRRGADEKELRKARDEGRAQDERWHLRKDGTRFFASGFVRPIREGEGKLRGFSKVARDVTERKQAEDRDRFLADLNRALQPLADPDELTAAAARMLGGHLEADRCAYAEVEADEDHFRITGDYTRGVPSIVGRFAVSDFGSEALRLMRENEPYVVDDAEADERVSATDLEAYRQTRIRAVVSVPLHKAGRFVAGMAVHQKTPRRWSSEEVELVRTVAERCWESIERARAVRNLRQSEERYRAVIEQSAEGFYLVDADTKRILEANPAFQELLGYEPEELRGRRVHELIDLPEEEVDAAVRRTLEAGRRLIGERRYRRKDGTLVEVEVEVGASVISYGGRRVICAVVRDMTERRRAEEALREVREAERGRMARDLHDGPLQDLSYAAQAMEILRLVPPEEAPAGLLDGALDALRRSSQEVRAAVNDLRREESERPFPEMLAALVERTRAMAPDQDVRLAVGERFPEAPPVRQGEELLSVVREALTNARRHSGARNVRVRLDAEDEKLVIEVSDDGRGFGPEAAPGVGFSSMRERAEVLGGNLEVESEAGEGTTVRLTVPRSGFPGGAPKDEPLRSDPGRQQNGGQA